MAFWGIEVEPGKPITHRFDKSRGRLHITRATLGEGWSNERSIVQCTIAADNPPIFICSLTPKRYESCQLDIRFEEADDVVFEVVGFQSVHLAGFYMGNCCTGNVVTKKIVGEDGDHSTCQDSDVKKLSFLEHLANVGHSEINKMKSKAQESTADMEAEVEGRQVIRRRTLASGLVVEDLEIGNHQNSKIVVPGSRVFIYYFGQLKRDDLIFESNFGADEPCSLWLPELEAIGNRWQAGICGMRIGDRRRITIPPSIPLVPFGRPSGISTNDLLVYEIELVG